LVQPEPAPRRALRAACRRVLIRDAVRWLRSAFKGLFACWLLFTSVSAQQPEPSVSNQFRQALDLAQHGDADRALSLTQRLLAQSPDFVPALKLRAALLEDAGRAAEAAVLYQKALALAPTDSDLLYKVGVAALIEGHNDEAIRLLQQHLHFEPKDGDALFYLAQAYHLANHDDLDLRAIRESLACEPKNPSVWQKYGELLVSAGDSETGFDWLRKAQQANPGMPRLQFDLGVASLDRMDFESALKYAQEAVAGQPQNVETLQLLASAQVKVSRWTDAATTFERILLLKSGDRDALLGLGRCQLEQKDYQAAVTTLRQLLQIDPTIILAHFYLARAYAGLGNQTEAQHESELHHQMIGQSSFAASALGSEQDRDVWGQARKLLEANREDAALKLFAGQEKGAASSPGHPYFLVGALYLYMGKPADGLRNLHRALEADPKVRGAHTYLGIYALQQGQLDTAAKEFETEIANDPNYETAIAELGLVRYRQQRWAEAANQLAKSHTRTPALLLALADAYFHLGNVKEANLNTEIAAAYARDDQELLEEAIDLLNRNGQAELAQRLAGTGKP